MQFPRKARRLPSINIINLIDILVVLLIFYVATTVFKKSQPNIKISVPSSTHATTTTEPNLPSVIYITSAGKFYLDDQEIDPAQLGDTLKSRKAANPDFKVALQADKDTPLGMFVKVYDAANTAGIPDLQMFVTPDKTQPESQPQPSPGP